MNYEKLQKQILNFYTRELKHESKYDEQFQKVVDNQTDIMIGKLYKLTKGKNITNVDLYGPNQMLSKISAICLDAVKGVDKECNMNGRLFQAMQAINIDLAKTTNLKIETTNEEIKKTVNKKNEADGLTLNQRLSKNRQEYYNKLLKTVVILASQKKSLADMADSLEKIVRGMCYANGRIMTTELNSFINEALIDIYLRLGIKNVEFSAVQDERTSMQCHENDGKVFAITELHTGVNKPPLHPHCRSILLPHE